MTQSTATADLSFERPEDDARRGASLGLRALTAAVVVVAALTLSATSVPGGYFLILMVLPMVWIWLGVLWIAMALIVARLSGWRRALKNGMLIATAVIALTTIAGVLVGAPLRVRLAASQPAFDVLAAGFTAPGAPVTLSDRTLGLFDAEKIERFVGGYRFLVKGTGFLDPVGLAYSPDGIPPNLGGEDRYERLDDKWWIWVESW